MLLLNTCKKEGLLRTAIPNGSTFQLCFSSEFHLNNFSLMELDDKFVEALREKFGPNVETKLTKEFYKLD
jgi:hypothetical protein